MIPYIPGLLQSDVWELGTMKDESIIFRWPSLFSSEDTTLDLSVCTNVDPESRPASLLRHDNGVRTTGDSISFKESFRWT